MTMVDFLKKIDWWKMNKKWCARDSNPRPSGFVLFRAALVTDGADGMILTLLGMEAIHSENASLY